MPSIYCTRCGQANPDDARFCLHCGTMLARGGAERPGETTSTISLGGDLAEADYDEYTDQAAPDSLPPGTALLGSCSTTTSPRPGGTGTATSSWTT